MKKILKLSLVLMSLVFLFACGKKEDDILEKYSGSFFDTFDTIVQVVGYTESEEEFDEYLTYIEDRFVHLNKLYDIYNEYDGINNIKTINDKSGMEPVKVDREIIDLLAFSKDWYQKTDGKVNIAMGSVFSIWKEYRDDGKDDLENANLPEIDKLKEASDSTDIEDIVIDFEKGTVFIKDKNLRIDVGSVAKGYATEMVADEVMKLGFKSGIINAGGNIRVLESPRDGVRGKWGIGIQDPDKFILPGEDSMLDTVFVNDMSVVTSGDYQRYYYVEGKRIHHLIDPNSLMPGENFRAVTVVTKDSGVADVLSTAIFLMDYEEGVKLLNDLTDTEGLWIFNDGQVKVTDGMKNIMKSFGASGKK